VSDLPSITEGEYSPLYNTLSKYLPDDFPPGPPFSNDRDSERYILIRTIEDFNYFNTQFWGKTGGKSHGFLVNGVPLSFNWMEFARTYAPKLDEHFSDPKEAMQALKEIYFAFGYHRDSWRKNKQARRGANLLYDRALKNLAKRHEAIRNREVEKINYQLEELTEIMFESLLKQWDLAMTKANFRDQRRHELLNVFRSHLMDRARYVTKWKEVTEILNFNKDSELYTFHNIQKPPSWYK